MLDLEKIVKTTRELVSFRSVNPPGEEEECARYIFERMKSEGIEAYLVDKPFVKRPQVVGVIRGFDNHPTLILNGHMDVVPEGIREAWKNNPFKATVEGGKIYGRGTCDMKTSLAIMLETGLLLSRKEPHGTLVLTFASGEERLEPGTEYLLKEFLPTLGLRGDFGIVMEPTSCSIGIAEGGGFWCQVNVKGVSTHASTPEKGINAISKASKIITKVDELNAQISMKTHHLLHSPTIKVTMIKGGTKENTVPDFCSLMIDRRTIPGEDNASARTEFMKTLEQIANEDHDFKYDLDIITSWEPVEVNEGEKIVQELKRSYERITSRSAQIVGVPYGTDMRNFVFDANIPAVVFGPGDIRNAHSVDEYIELADVDLASKVLLDLIERILF
ncbi:MAG: M20 family metallopeptidase [Candidatus Methanomethylicaceae archaeon]